MPALTVLLLLMAVAAVTDILQHKIYNWNTYSGILAAFLLNSCGLGLFEVGSQGFQESLIGFFACGIILLFSFVLFNIGGGDVKLIAMMGAFLGLHRGIEAMLWTFVLGSIMAAVILIWQLGFWRIVTKTFQHLVLLIRARSWVPLTKEERQPLKRGLFLAPAGLAAVCVVTFPEWSKLLS